MKIRDLFLFSLAIILAFFIYSKPDNREKTFTLIAKISAVGKPYRFGTEEIVGLFLEEVQSPSDEFFWIGRLLIKRRGVIFSDNWRVWPVTVIPPALIGKDIVISAGTSPIIRIKKIRLL